MQNIIISIIVPIYKAEKYIERCINSLLSQTFENYEIILVDDGSPDNSGTICDKYSKENTKIRVIHKENGGVTSARRIGVENAKGEFIVFVDADDELQYDSLNQMFNVCKENKCDILVTARTNVRPNKERKVLNKCEGLLSNEKFIFHLLKNNVSIAPHPYMTKRSLFYLSEALNIPKEITINEDLIMNIKLGLKANNIFVANSIDTYKYYYTPNSAGKQRKNLIYWEKVFIIINDILKESNLFNIEEIRKAYYSYVLRIMRVAINEPLHIKNKIIKEIKWSYIFNYEDIKNYLFIRFPLLLFILKRRK